MSTTLKKITARAKQLRSKHPGKKWTSYVKEAGKEYRAGKIGVIQENIISGIKKRRKVRKKKIGAYKFIERHETKSSPVKKTYRVLRSKKGTIKTMQTVSGIERHLKEKLQIQLGKLLLKREVNTKAKQHHKLTKQINSVRAKLRKL